MEFFSPEVCEQLRVYVYRLIDPRNGEKFYVGKGIVNRVFAHIKAELDSDDPGDKLKRIHEIRNTGFEVAHVIHRHNLDNKTAFEVEAALIDAYPGLTNEVIGAGSNEFGAMHAQEVIEKYQAETAVFDDPVVLINVNRSASGNSLYEATRYAWKISPKKARRAKYVIAVSQGITRAVFVATKWLPAEQEFFPGREPVPGRYGFIGHEAPEEIQKKYVRKRLPEQYRKRGASNPIKYTFR